MENDSLYNEMEPRYLRPCLPATLDFQCSAEVSEPSLFHYGNDEHAALVRTRDQSASTLTPHSCCSCKTVVSPQSLDNSFKELMSRQNEELRRLREQIQTLLSYQENLQSKSHNSRSRESFDEATQTTFFETTPENYQLAPTGTSPAAQAQPCSSPGTYQRSKLAQDRTEITLTFRDLHLETIVEQPSSPQPSVHVSIQDYPDFSKHLDGSRDDGTCENVMEQIQKLLNQTKQTELADRQDGIPAWKRTEASVKPDSETRRVTFQRLRELGISFVGTATGKSFQNSFFMPRVPQDYADLDTHTSTAATGVDRSIEMQMLEKKYLGREVQEGFHDKSSPVFSVCTQQYLQRYGLLEQETRTPNLGKSRQNNNPGKFLDSVLYRDQPKYL